MSECTENERALIEAVLRFFQDWPSNFSETIQAAASAVCADRTTPEAMEAYRRAVAKTQAAAAEEKTAHDKLPRSVAKKIRDEVWHDR